MSSDPESSEHSQSGGPPDLPDFTPVDEDPNATQGGAKQPESLPESIPVTVQHPAAMVWQAPRRQTAGLLGIFLGGLGAHHFYLGSKTAGVALLATGCCGVGIVVGAVEGAMLLAMSDDEFEQKYVHRKPDSMEFVFQERG